MPGFNQRDKLNWACDEPSETPQVEIDCPFCQSGNTERMPMEGAICENGRLHFFRCPSMILSNAPTDISQFVMNFFNFYHPLGKLPTSLGLEEHPNSFVEAYRHFLGLNRKLDRWISDRVEGHGVEADYHGC